MIFSHVKISYFLRVFKYDFSQWPKTLYNTCVYIINYGIEPKKFKDFQRYFLPILKDFSKTFESKQLSKIASVSTIFTW